MLDSAAIDRIVQNVLKQISPSPVAARTEAKSAAPANVAVSKTATPADESSPISFTDIVITGDLLAERVKGGGKRIILSPKAILTPTAKDYIRIQRLEVIRAAGEKKSLTGKASWKLIVVTSTPTVDRVYRELGPAWTRELLGCPDDAASFVIGELARGEIEGAAIIARQHIRAACRANRHEKVRAAAVSDPAMVKDARTQMRLNTIAIDPTNKTYFELRNMLAALTTPFSNPTDSR
jgi:hypothetical protein